MQLSSLHTFHIPVMGTGYTIDTPVKVAPYGISSVVSIVDDILMEKMRNFYSSKFNLPFSPISDNEHDSRAKRITAYLNLIDQITKEKFDRIIHSVSEKREELDKYIQLLPDFSTIKKEFNELLNNHASFAEIRNRLKEKLLIGSIDVNVMTKVDKVNYKDGEQLPTEFNDAHAALRGYAESNLASSLILSAGMNPHLYGYLEHFEDFYPTTEGYIKKKIVLKVSDYRSALIQGKFLAKKGIWVSEYRIESGLNCGGHAFASNGLLLGPILEDFKNNREELQQTVHEIMVEALTSKGRPFPKQALDLKITVQGGVGTAEEHNFLIDHFKMNSVGWGSPFLLVPEVCDVDEQTRNLLSDATEDDLFLSHSSPLGVRFNNLKGNSRDKNSLTNTLAGNPGSTCTKRYMVANTEYTEKPICTASRQYQKLKMEELKAQNLPEEEYLKELKRMSEKSCLCKGLAVASLLANNIDTGSNGEGVAICPGPNMAYFSGSNSLSTMVDHIYGRTNIIQRDDRPHMFVKELMLYIDYLKEQENELPKDASRKQLNSLEKFKANLKDGIDYYLGLFKEDKYEKIRSSFISLQDKLEKKLA